jgi:hypothetical protein
MRSQSICSHRAGEERAMKRTISTVIDLITVAIAVKLIIRLWRFIAERPVRRDDMQ